jgi:predicted acyltransferase
LAVKVSLNSIVDLFASRQLGTRDESVDALRGLAILVMILVNHSPPTDDRYAFLLHAPWTGWTVADTVFPVFLFLVGVSIVYSSSCPSGNSEHIPWDRIIRRTLILLTINFVLVNFPYYELDKLVVYGTLTRIGYCYFFAVLLYYLCGWRVQLVMAISILFAQWWILTRFEVPGIGAGVLTIEGNASVYIDRLVFGSFAERLHLNGPITQGLLPGASAVATTILGALAGRWIRYTSETVGRDYQLLALGTSLYIAGNLWGLSYPVSKPLWTGSYVCMMTGLSLFLIGSLNLLSKFTGFSRLLFPLRVAGVNALFIYVFAQLFQRVLVYGRLVQEDGTTIRYRYYIYEQWVEPMVNGKPGALLYALVFLAICYAATYFLYRQRIFVKL